MEPENNLTVEKKILVVEDNPLNTELVTDLLEVENFIVYQARTAEEGMRCARQEMPDLIVMDINLPGVDGLSATKVLKSQAATQHIPIIALTAHAMKGDAETALHAGFDGYLSKPIDTRTFVATIRGFFAPPLLAGNEKI